MERRDFIKFGLGSMLLAESNALFAKTASSNQPNLLFVFLRGGADGLSMLVPYKDSNYYEARPTIAIPKNKCLTVNTTFGLNPALSVYDNWYKKNQAVFVPLAGQLNNSRSHFQAQDVLEYGINDNVTYNSGFLARLQEVLGGSKTMSFTENITPIMSSSKVVIPTIAIPHLKGVFNFNSSRDFEYSGKLKDVYQTVENNLDLIKKLPNGDDQYKLSYVAEFMKTGGYNIGFVDFNDWDTHGEQGSLDGKLFNLLANLNGELDAFRKSFGEEKWKNTLVVVMSEFGRTVKQNGNGSDHGHGNLMSLFGGLITKSQVAGEWFDLKEKNLHQDRELKVMHQYRDVLAEAFIKMYGLSASQLNYVFPGCKPTTFKII
jgi:uncharacterized protein (DUF1501 family)